MRTLQILPPLLAGLLTAGCSSWSRPTIRGSGVLTTESRQVSGFDRVSLHGSGQLTLIQGEEEGLTVETDDNLLPYISSEVRNRQLVVGPENVSISPTRDIKYVLRLKQLESLKLSGSFTVEAASLVAGDLDVDISGSGRIAVGHLAAESTSLNVSGSGRATFAGEVVRQRLRISGSGDYEAGELHSQVADVRISGSGSATLWVTEQLDAGISGSGTVKYYGLPQANQQVSGSGNIRSLGNK
ncbi:MAG: DUF2807 domain-containing protein [Verrucomicrobiales bacterium]|nr:DUF2807 domain-containing protein [Verrucomicrobiales bacterium]